MILTSEIVFVVNTPKRETEKKRFKNKTQKERIKKNSKNHNHNNIAA